MIVAVAILTVLLGAPCAAALDDADAQTARAEIVRACVGLLKLDETAAVVTRVEARLRVDPDFVDGFLLLGNALYLEKRYGEAIRAFEAGLKREPGKVALALPLGFCHFELGRVDDAERFFAALVRIQPDNPKARYGYGFVLGKRGAIEAIAELERAITIDPNYWRAHDALGDVHFDRGEFAAAEAAYCVALRGEGWRPSTWYRLGLALARQKKAGESKQALARYRELNDLVTRVDGLRTRLLAEPGDDDARARLAQAWLELGQTAKAVGLARIVLARDATNAVALGVVARAEGAADR
ncbi:MAG: tetratricopeptide repeat protein [Planctomycetes bacterium]|nr:tetratricopeptide repeat protein [Planctomycetota bacterium]MCC7171796.1 tetratricopeptide repeat protein [Planctomycetota bacterium]